MDPAPVLNFYGRSFSAGDVLIICDPWVWSLDISAHKNRCANCFQLKEGLRTCSGCKLHRYCSTACQKADWKLEQNLECGMLKGLGSRTEVVRLRSSGNLMISTTFDLIAKIASKVKTNKSVEIPGLGSRLPVEILKIFPKNPAVSHSFPPIFLPGQLDWFKTASEIGISSADFLEYSHMYYPL
ncbi:N-lysine methyltransferase SMYD2-A-like [Paramacrobiotus metropolitanus]|uniref:N-lysine methyltransferase SMYD2-A-like n=1 Tax=Paramacrobiotus metropolitanus TaxID=2943436 RepID=UPI002445CCD5|nr:N-lysine methyltransferase SMYD2-A-like [Paramacrobiotus metropolitanus]